MNYLTGRTDNNLTDAELPSIGAMLLGKHKLTTLCMEGMSAKCILCAFYTAHRQQVQQGWTGAAYGGAGIAWGAGEL